MHKHPPRQREEASEASTRRFEPLPPLDEIRPEHVAYVRAIVAWYSVSPAHERADLVQDVLLEAYLHWPALLDARALLFGITRHAVYRWWESRESRSPARAASWIANQPARRSAEEKYEEIERRELVWAAIDELPDIFAAVFIRIEIEGMRMRQVARALRIPLFTGYTRLHLARKRFLKALRRQLLRRGMVDRLRPMTAAQGTDLIEQEPLKGGKGG